MIKRSMAGNLITRLSKHLDYNINIMDENGIIIASRDADRINDFHEAAYNIIHGNEEIEIIHNSEEFLPGVKPGVNLPIVYRQKKIGVVGVTGNPNEIKNLAFAIKTAVETMLEYEFYKEKIMRRQDKKNHFINTLLYEEEINAGVINTLAEKLEYKSDIPRIPIILNFPSSMDISEVLKTLKKSRLHKKQDMSFITTDQNILVFKTLENFTDLIVANIKSSIKDYLKSFEDLLRDSELPTTYCAFVGSFQTSLKMYRLAYQHTHWLMNYYSVPERKVYYFFDNTYAFFRSKIPKNEYYNVFSEFSKVINNSVKKKYLATIGALITNDMNIKAAAEKLGVHRNTIYSRLEKLSDLLGINPLEEYTDRFFLYDFLEFCKLE